MVIGAMPPHHALEYLTSDALLITPGTREDLILAAMSSCIMGDAGSTCVGRHGTYGRNRAAAKHTRSAGENVDPGAAGR